MEYSRKVISISRAEVENFPSAYRTDASHVTFESTPNWERVPIQVPADLTISTKTEDKQRIYTAKLEFRYCGTVYDRRPYVYLVKLANGKSRVIGGAQRPYPICETNEQHDSGNSSSQLPAMTVTYSSPQDIPYL